MRKNPDTLEVELRGQTVTVELSIYSPEPDVGIMGPYWDEETIRDENGHILAWDLNEKEIDIISQAVNDVYYADREHDYEDDR